MDLVGEAERWREHQVVKAEADWQEGHAIPAIDASVCNSMYQAAFEEVLGTKAASQNLTNGIFPSKI